MLIPFIEIPNDDKGTAKTLVEFLDLSGQWHEGHDIEDSGALSQLWYRGVSQKHDELLPIWWGQTGGKEATAGARNGFTIPHGRSSVSAITQSD